jgi:Mg2+-importing ATPase
VLLTSSSLFVSQASLTGELMPADKFPRLSCPPPEYVFNVLESENICLAGTAVNAGSGTALVLSTGLGTYMASIAKELANSRPVNAVQLGVRRVSMILLVFMLVCLFPCACFSSMETRSYNVTRRDRSWHRSYLSFKAV